MISVYLTLPSTFRNTFARPLRRCGSPASCESAEARNLQPAILSLELHHLYPHLSSLALPNPAYRKIKLRHSRRQRRPENSQSRSQEQHFQFLTKPARKSHYNRAEAYSHPNISKILRPDRPLASNLSPTIRSSLHILTFASNPIINQETCLIGERYANAKSKSVIVYVNQGVLVRPQCRAGCRFGNKCPQSMELVVVSWWECCSSRFQ